MKYYIGNTDHSWYNFLKALNPAPEDVNFWQPGGTSNFRTIQEGSPFLLRLKSPINRIAGVAFFMKHSNLPISMVWDIFGERNGTESYQKFMLKIQSLRSNSNKLETNPNIGCLVLTNPIFFHEKDWINVPDNWALNIVQGKTFSTEDPLGNAYWNKVQFVINQYSHEINNSDIEPDNTLKENSPIYTYGVTKIRVGQGAFRVMVTDAYSRRCAISGERTLPVLEAAHIQPYAASGINQTSNGLLLRSDLHKLFDSGYITITDQYHVEISKRIKVEFENGKDYYKYHGQELASLPGNINDYPNKNFLLWHNENVFR